MLAHIGKEKCTVIYVLPDVEILYVLYNCFHIAQEIMVLSSRQASIVTKWSKGIEVDSESLDSEMSHNSVQ